MGVDELDLNKISDDAEHTHTQMYLLDNVFSEMETQPTTQIYATISVFSFMHFPFDVKSFWARIEKYTVKN